MASSYFPTLSHLIYPSLLALSCEKEPADLEEMSDSVGVSGAVVASYQLKCVCVCLRSCPFSFCRSVRPVWPSGTVTAWRWWTTCRKPSFCACQRWICTAPLILTSASLARLAETGNPRQVTRAHTLSQHCHFTQTQNISPLSSTPSLFPPLSSVCCPPAPFLSLHQNAFLFKKMLKNICHCAGIEHDK